MKSNGSDHPRLAPTDALGREIQAVLELIRPLPGADGVAKYDGYAVPASEAYLHLARERDPEIELRVVRHGSGNASHWWLTDSKGRVIDLTLSAADRRQLKLAPAGHYPYESGRGAMFRTGPGKPSKRAAAIIELVQSRTS